MKFIKKSWRQRGHTSRSVILSHIVDTVKDVRRDSRLSWNCSNKTENKADVCAFAGDSVEPHVCNYKIKVGSDLILQLLLPTTEMSILNRTSFLIKRSFRSAKWEDITPSLAIRFCHVSYQVSKCYKLYCQSKSSLQYQSTKHFTVIFRALY